MLEKDFQSKLKKEIEKRFPGCYVQKIECAQGIPDLLILYNKHWALLECKQKANAHHQPNQDYWVSYFNQLSFSSFIYPENMEEVLNEMEQSFNS